ncbi:hypothetical protein CB1_000076002 [Camelus ferus]|nr:hypothetical protein CB1_000076002 [Camelus ferus]
MALSGVPPGTAPGANPGGILVMKSCAPTCPNSTVSSDGRALSVYCCQGSQCNRSAAMGLTGSHGALWISALASLLWVLLQAACHHSVTEPCVLLLKASRAPPRHLPRRLVPEECGEASELRGPRRHLSSTFHFWAGPTGPVSIKEGSTSWDPQCHEVALT